MSTTPGRRLYERFVGSQVSDAAHYYGLMNPGVQKDWERLGREWETGFLRNRVETAEDVLAKSEIRTRS